MQENQKRKILDIILRVCSPIPLILAIPVSILLFGNVGYGGVYQVVLEVALGVNFMLIVASCLLVILGKARSRVLRRTVAAVICFTVCCLLIIGVEGLKASLGVGCEPFWSDDSCAEEAMFVIGIYVTLPFIFVPLNAVLASFLGAGLWQELRHWRKSKKRKTGQG